MSSTLAILGGDPLRKEPYPEYLTTGPEEKRYVDKVMDSGVLSGFVARGGEQFYGGSMVLELESKFTEFFGTRHAVSFNSGTSALHGTLIAAGVSPGDEVIVPPYTMSATAAAVLMCKAVPVFVDIEPDNFCLDADKLEAAVTERTKAIITVNLLGQVSELDKIANVARNHGLVFIEDNAQGAGALFHGKFAGTVSDMSMFSLNRHKSIQCGEGGVVLTDDDELARRLQLSRNHGEVVLDDWGVDEISWLVGYNYRMSELSAAVAIPQLAKLPQFIEQRVERVERLRERLKGFDFLTLPQAREGCTHVWYLFGMLFDEKAFGVSRDVFLKALNAEGINGSSYTRPVHLLPVFLNNTDPASPGFSRVFPTYDRPLPYAKGLCPVVERVEGSEIIVTNIIRQTHPISDVDEFARAVEKIADNAGALRKIRGK